MRDCPFCAQSIQDEAVVCRYCGLDLELPDWLRGKVRCDFCAEWISADSTVCTYCKSELSPGAGPAAGRLAGLHAASDSPQETETNNESELRPFVENPEVTDLEENLDEAEAFIAKLQAADPEPKKYEEPDPLRAAPLDQLRQDYIYDEYEKSFDDSSGFEDDLSRSERFSNLDLGRFRPLALAGLTLIFLALLVAVAVRSDLTAALSAPSTEQPTPVATQSSQVLATEGSTPAVLATEGVAAEDALAGCVAWDDVSSADAGSELCVYGEVKRWYVTSELPFVAIFSEDIGTFIVIDRLEGHTDIQPGTCIMATGPIELFGGVRPYINAEASLKFCP